jgi:MarR family transcriptional regulator, transcriptional regulator for hemolysin
MVSDSPDRTLGFVLHDVARLLRKRFEQRARVAKLGLTRSQWQLLAYLARQEGINQTALAQLLEIEPITLTRQLDRLESSGLVERRPVPGDRRARVLFLTPAAQPLLARIRELGAQVREEAMAGLSPDARDQLMTALLAVKANLSDRTAADSPETEMREAANA